MHPSYPFLKANAKMTFLEMVAIHPSQNEQHSLLTAWFRSDTLELLSKNMNKLHESWSKLTLDTHVAESTSIPDVIIELRMVDDIVSHEDAQDWQHRLAYLQLHSILETLERIIGCQRRKFLFHSAKLGGYLATGLAGDSPVPWRFYGLPNLSVNFLQLKPGQCISRGKMGLTALLSPDSKLNLGSSLNNL